jgi:DNA-binding NarL/FixJ family response regulator
MADKIHIVIADDHALFREGLATILATENDIEVVGQAGNAEAAVRIVEETLPDLVLLDIDMPGGGLNAAQEIGRNCPSTRMIMLTASEDDDHLLHALRMGARAYILKGVGARELLRIVRAVISGESYVPPDLAAGLLTEFGGGIRKGEEQDPFHSLTTREREILDGLASGLSNKEIAQKVFLSEKTVKHYVTIVLQKLQVRNRVEAALLAQKRG